MVVPVVSVVSAGSVTITSISLLRSGAVVVVVAGPGIGTESICLC